MSTLIAQPPERDDGGREAPPRRYLLDDARARGPGWARHQGDRKAVFRGAT